jgi:uroporphyrinogen decarboxylase
MPQFLGYPVTDRSSWADFRQRLDPDTPGRFTPALAELARQSPQRTTPLGVWLGGTYGYIRNWMGVEKASCLFYDDPRLVEEMIEHLTGFYSALARRLFATGIELDWVMFWEDMAYNRASLLSPSLYRRYCLPFYRVMVERVRQHGVPVVGLDSDGNIEELLPLWLDAGITVMHPMEVAAGMDVRTARRRYGRNVTFLGGIDKRALANGRPAIDAEVVPKVRELRDSGGGFMVQCDHGVPPDIALDDFRYFHELVRRLFAEG